MNILCIYLIKILLKCFQTFQIMFRLIFYLFIHNAIDCTMSVCGDNYQPRIWCNIGILCCLFDVFYTNNINRFIQIIFGTIETCFTSFWSLITNYISYNCNCNNSSSRTNSKTKLFVKMHVVSSWLIIASLFGITIVCVSNSVSESIFGEIAADLNDLNVYFGMSFVVKCVKWPL